MGGITLDTTMLAIVEAYFQAFQLKDLNSVGNLLSENITLVDWDISANGKKEVLSAIAEIFQNLETINFNNLIINQTGNIFWCQFELPLPGGEILYILDKITLDQNNQIISIEAFKH